MIKCDHNYWSKTQLAKFVKIANRETKLAKTTDQRDFWERVKYYA